MRVSRFLIWPSSTAFFWNSSSIWVAIVGQFGVVALAMSLTLSINWPVLLVIASISASVAAPVGALALPTALPVAISVGTALPAALPVAGWAGALLLPALLPVAAPTAALPLPTAAIGGVFALSVFLQAVNVIKHTLNTKADLIIAQLSVGRHRLSMAAVGHAFERTLKSCFGAELDT